MSATTVDSAFPSSDRPHEWAPPTADLDPTTDLHDESTSDFEPATLDEQAPRAATSESAANSAPRPSPEHGTLHARALSPGATLKDRYLVEGLIGVGGVAMVYRARDMHSSENSAPNRQVALKTPRPELHDAARARTRLTHEHQHTAALSHPNIVRAFDLYADSEPCFMTLELLEGKLLSTLLHDAGKPLPSQLAHRILQGCARALAHAHGRKIVHGDFKPGNVFLTRDQNVKVIDFGAAAAPLTSESRIAAGTPAYASPEVLSGETPEARDDVFSFACVAYELLTGKHPFDRRSSLQARDEGCLPPRVWSLSASQWLMLLSGLSWSRDQRPSDVEALAIALAPQLRNESTPTETGINRRRPASHEFADDLMPPQRSWGFFAFLACAVAVTFMATQRQTENTAAAREPPSASVPEFRERTLAPAGLMAAAAATDSVSAGAPLSRTPFGRTNSEGSVLASTPAPESGAGPAPIDPPPPTAKRKAAPTSDISFDSSSIVTSEGSVAAVFLIKRSQPLTGRTRVQWTATSGTADAGIDFAASAAGTVEFADGQAQRAIYVPLRNDLLKEEDETFTVHLKSAQGARLGKTSSVTATIRDDD